MRWGVRRAFASDQADFSGMTQDQAFLSQVLQETHIAIDEKGVEAATFTKIDYAGMAAPNENEAHMILNRPFYMGLYQMGCCSLRACATIPQRANRALWQTNQLCVDWESCTAGFVFSCVFKKYLQGCFRSKTVDESVKNR